MAEFVLYLSELVLYLAEFSHCLTELYHVPVYNRIFLGPDIVCHVRTWQSRVIPDKNCPVYVWTWCRLLYLAEFAFVLDMAKFALFRPPRAEQVVAWPFKSARTMGRGDGKQEEWKHLAAILCRYVQKMSLPQLCTHTIWNRFIHLHSLYSIYVHIYLSKTFPSILQYVIAEWENTFHLATLYKQYCISFLLMTTNKYHCLQVKNFKRSKKEKSNVVLREHHQQTGFWGQVDPGQHEIERWPCCLTGVSIMRNWWLSMKTTWCLSF